MGGKEKEGREEHVDGEKYSNKDRMQNQKIQKGRKIQREAKREREHVNFYFERIYQEARRGPFCQVISLVFGYV